MHVIAKSGQADQCSSSYPCDEGLLFLPGYLFILELEDEISIVYIRSEPDSHPSLLIASFFSSQITSY